MRRVTSLFLALIVMAVLLTGCGANPVGQYVVKAIAGKPVSEYIDSLGLTVADLGVETAEEFMTIDVRENGTFVITMMGAESGEGEWTLDGSKLGMTLNEETQEASFSGGEITMKANDEAVVFRKK